MEGSSITPIASSHTSNSYRLSERCQSKIHGRNAELVLLKSSLKDIRSFSHQGERQHLDQNETLNRSSSDSAPNQSRITFFEAVEKNESNNEDNVFGRESGRSFIFVQGESGTGKTTLVRTTFQDESCLFCSGKFERGGHRPFAVLTMCLNELCHAMAALLCEDSTRDNDTSQFSYPAQIRSVLNKQEIGILARVAPKLVNVMGTIEYHEEDDSNDLTLLQSANDIERLKFIIRNFFAAVATKETPIVFFWDDLQWIDAASFEVLKAMSLNCALRHFLFVGSFRIDDVTQLRTKTLSFCWFVSY